MVFVSAGRLRVSPVRPASIFREKNFTTCRRITNSSGYGRGRSRLVSFASAEASKSIMEGAQKYDRGDKMGALQCFEDSLSQSPTLRQQQIALYNSTCVHASFGDVELAQVTLRDALERGLNFEAASKDPEMVKLTTSPQVLIQLRKFAQTMARVKMEGKDTSKLVAKAPAEFSIPSGNDDVSELLSTEISGIDSSVFGIVRRVAILLAIGIVSFVVLFYAGLKFTFPEM